MSQAQLPRWPAYTLLEYRITKRAHPESHQRHRPLLQRGGEHCLAMAQYLLLAMSLQRLPPILQGQGLWLRLLSGMRHCTQSSSCRRGVQGASMASGMAWQPQVLDLSRRCGRWRRRAPTICENCGELCREQARGSIRSLLPTLTMPARP